MVGHVGFEHNNKFVDRNELINLINHYRKLFTKGHADCQNLNKLVEYNILKPKRYIYNGEKGNSFVDNAFQKPFENESSPLIQPGDMEVFKEGEEFSTEDRTRILAAIWKHFNKVSITTSFDKDDDGFLIVKDPLVVSGIIPTIMDLDPDIEPYLKKRGRGRLSKQDQRLVRDSLYNLEKKIKAVISFKKSFSEEDDLNENILIAPNYHYEFDHIVPYTLGGSKNISNCQITSKKYNEKKLDRIEVTDKPMYINPEEIEENSKLPASTVSPNLWGDQIQSFSPNLWGDQTEGDPNQQFSPNLLGNQTEGDPNQQFSQTFLETSYWCEPDQKELDSREPYSSLFGDPNRLEPDPTVSPNLWGNQTEGDLRQQYPQPFFGIAYQLKSESLLDEQTPTPPDYKKFRGKDFESTD